jgi:hypothetical protein
MKSITLHGIDDDLDKKISEKSEEYGLSQNRTIKAILKDSLLADKRASRREMFSGLFGTWTTVEKNAFEKRVLDLENVNDEDSTK